MSDKRTRNIFHQFSTMIENPPDSEVIAVGYLMRDWLESQIADFETTVDQGAGFSAFDLWVTVGGKKLFITIKEQS